MKLNQGAPTRRLLEPDATAPVQAAVVAKGTGADQLAPQAPAPPIASGAGHTAALQAPRSSRHPGLIVRLDEPPPGATEVAYSATAASFGALSERVLDLVEGPFSQRARRKERGERTGGAANYREVMSELDLGSGASKALAGHVMKRVVEAHAQLGSAPAMPPGLAHLRPVDPRAMATLLPWEQKLLTNGAGNFPSSWFEIDSAIFNGLSLTFHRCMRADATIDAARVAAELSPMALEVLGIAERQFQGRDAALKHWASGERSAYEPDDRPITKRDLLTVGRADPQLCEALLAAAPIPLALPVLDACATANSRRLDDFVVVMVQHALGSIVPFVDTLMDKGARDLEFVPVPYSTNALVAETLARRGIALHDSCPDGSLAPRDVEAIMERDVKRALDAAIAKARASGKQLLVIDDGGIVVRLLAGRAKTLPNDNEAYRGLPVRVVEQTTRGITEALAVGPLPSNITLVDMARSAAKAFEGPMVGKDAHVVLDRAMRDCGKGGIAGKDVLLIGYGVIGQNVARAMRDAGARVTIHDVDDETRARARAQGFAVADELPAALKDKDLVVGCSGHRSVQRDDFYAMKRGTVLASLSSKAMELFTDHIDGQMSAAMYPAEGHGEAAVASYGRAFKHHQVVDNKPGDRFGQVVYYLVNSGCPATFTGHVNAVPPEDIQLTEAIKLEAVMQAAASDIGLGITALEDDRQQRALTAMDLARPGWR